MKEYLKQLEDALKDGTERSIYKPLCNFLERFIQEKYKKQVSTIAEQSSKNYQKGVGFPDITLKEKDFTIGYIEVKLPYDNLDDKKFKVQFDRYKNSLENIIFTNLKNWQLWQWNKEGTSKKVKEIIFDYTDPKPESFLELLNLFLNFTIIQASTSEQLAINLAKRTKLLADLLCEISENSLLIQTKEAFQTALLNDIDDKSFTNLIAETFTYSLFIAALEHLSPPNPLASGNLGNNHNDLTLTTAIDYIPEAIPVLHDLYKLAQDLSRQIPEIKESVELILKELNSCDITKIRNSFYLNDNTQKEPTLYFYETFLEEYDKETKKKRGVFYTEKPIVDFIVRSVDELLTQNFGLENGLMNSEVKLLDPATGTGSFLASSIELIKNKIDQKYKILNLEKDQFIKEVSNHILQNFFGFEFMIAPYTVAHLKLNLLLKSFGFELKNNDRLKIYVANTLDDPAKEPINLFGFSRISEESKKAKEVKNQKDIIAIIGNPPYSGSSQNPSINKNTKKLTWIGEQIESYKYYENQKLDEKNPKWIQDDYVKFIRFAQYQIDSKGSGVIGYIVPHGFLDNPTFRYMRKSLMKSFSEIYILDLHGNNKKKEKAPDGSKDENVFDIEQGVAIVLFVKLPNHETPSVKGAGGFKLYHGDLYGKREDKFKALREGNFRELCKTKLQPKGEMSYFVPRGEDLEYEKFWSVKDIFKVSSVGVVTGKDKLFINSDKTELMKNLKKESIQIDKDLIQKIAYRPFDSRYIYYHSKLIERARESVMQHLLHPNVALVTRRQAPDHKGNYKYVFITENIMADGYIRSDNKGSESVFPLYLRENPPAPLTGGVSLDCDNSNFTESFKKYKQKHLIGFTDEQIFYYIYGLLHSPNYRTKYNEFLKTDFPRIDFSFDINKISSLGEELAQLHLLKHPIFEQTDKWNLKVEGNNYLISFARKADLWKNNKIYINENTFIDGIEQEVFEFMIGGYQVLDKWLSDRKNTTLSSDELLHYLKIIVSLKQTSQIMNELNKTLSPTLFKATASGD